MMKYTFMSYKRFLDWYDDRKEDGAWYSYEAIKLAEIHKEMRKMWFFKNYRWKHRFEKTVREIVNNVNTRIQSMKEQIMEEINFKAMGLDRYEVLCALYNKSKPLGLGILHFTPENLTLKEAHEQLDGYDYADYVKGRVIKVKLPENAESFSPRLYDRDNGEGAALIALQEYAKQKESA